MYNSDMPTRQELPSTGKLIASTVIAALVALVLLVTVVMPAEYALDPTGAGRLLGLTEMGEIKQQLDEEAAADEAASLVAVTAATEDKAESPEPAAKEDEGMEPATPATEPAPEPEIEDVAQAMAEPKAEPTPAAPTQEAPAPASADKPLWQDEVRVVLTPGQGTEYKLTMNEGAIARFSWVSEGGPLNYDTHGNGSGQAISYEKGRGVPADEGTLEAAFTGDHGWFFRNRNDNDITLVLRTGGDYGELKKLL